MYEFIAPPNSGGFGLLNLRFKKFLYSGDDLEQLTNRRKLK